MGEVYRARDARLDRDVAIKILPEAFAADAERVARFQREAKVLASLNHPNIAIIHGPEQAEGAHALVMELVEGEDLAQRIARGAIPIDEALPIAKQIAEALEAAHEQGIVHRDLKPANIKLRPDGTVKVLDFGLAKALEPMSIRIDATASPTITSPAVTGVGVLLGTAAYMSPEQAKGRPADKRSDIWAFGCVLFEMLTRHSPFGGEDVSDTLANVLKREPDWNALPGDTPPAIRALLKRLLERDRRRRVSDIAAAIFAIDEGANLAAPNSSTPPEHASRPWHAAVAAGTAAAILGAAAAGTAVWLGMRPPPPRVERFTIELPRGAAATIADGTRSNVFDHMVAITPDGTGIAYVGNEGKQLFARAFDRLEAMPLISGQNLRSVFTSPDGQWFGIVDNFTSLRKVPVTGGPSVAITTLDGSSRGASWAPDDTIIFATINPGTGLQRVSAGGGVVTVLTRPDRDELDHLWPQVLPGGRHVLFTITAAGKGLDAAQIAVLDLAGGTRKILVQGGSDARYVSSGHLVYVAGGRLQAVGFDLERLETRGTPAPVVSQLAITTSGAGDFAVTADGTLAFVEATAPEAIARTLVWVDRQGREQPLAAPARSYRSPRISPDGTRVALFTMDQELDLWVWDLVRGTLTRLTFDPAQDGYPVWTPDGRRLIFASEQAGRANLYAQAAEGTGTPERLTDSLDGQFPLSISPDGARVIFRLNTATLGLGMLTLEGRRVETLLDTAFNEDGGAISPNGRWLAYHADSSGRDEVYVRPFPRINEAQYQISTSGGVHPRWARNGHELFYLAPDGALMTVDVDANGAAWRASLPLRIVERRYFFDGAAAPFDISPDGQRFLMLKEAGGDSARQAEVRPRIVVVRHWFEELQRLVPTN